MSNAEKLKALKLTIDKIDKDFGKGSVMMMNEKSTEPMEVVSTGSIGLDVALGIGGLPRGRVIEIYGPESSGKTTIATHVIAEAQKKGGMCAFIDAEHAFDSNYAKQIGRGCRQSPDLTAGLWRTGTGNCRPAHSFRGSRCCCDRFCRRPGSQRRTGRRNG